MPRDADHQTQIPLDQRLARFEVAVAHGARELKLLFRREQRMLTDIVEVELRDIGDEVRRETRHRRFKRQLGGVDVGRGLLGRGRFDLGGRFSGFLRAKQIRHALARAHAGGRYRAGSIGLPRRRISKCSFT